MKTTKNDIKVFVDSGNCITPLGFNLSTNQQKIESERTAITQHSNTPFWDTPFYGAIINKEQLNTHFSSLGFTTETYSNLEKMMLAAVYPILKKYKNCIAKRCGLIVSTTKGNIEALDKNSPLQYYLHILANKIAQAIGVKTEPIVLSNACVSGIMAVSVAKRFIQTGEYDHFIVVGGDLFSSFVFSGFQAFQAVSAHPCRPYDKSRDGITLGEAAAALFVSKDPAMFEDETIFKIVGDSSINDANHISGPSRTGEGLYLSIQNALKSAGIESNQIDVISAHGTATEYNDEMEGQAFNRVKLQDIPVFSLKGYFGHTLGAAGLIETIISLDFAKKNKIPRSIGYSEHGLTLPLAITETTKTEVEQEFVLKTASGFGGSNTAVIFEKVKK